MQGELVPRVRSQPEFRITHISVSVSHLLQVICVNLVQCLVGDCGKWFPSVFEKNLMMKVKVHIQKYHGIIVKVSVRFFDPKIFALLRIRVWCFL